MVKSGKIFQTVVPTLAASFAGFVGGTAIAWVLACALPAAFDALPPTTDPKQAPSLDALMAAVYADEDGDSDRLTEVAAGVYRGGPGLGTLVVRQDGSPIAVSVENGEPGSIGAAWAVAGALNARAVHVCEGKAACKAGRSAIGLNFVVVRVVAGPTTVLRLPAQRQDFALGALAALLPGLRIDPGDDLSLEIDPATRLVAANSVLGVDPSGVARARWSVEPSPPVPVSLSELDAEVVRPVCVWLSGSSSADVALRVAAGGARRLGWRVEATADVAVIEGPDIYVLLQRGGTPMIVRSARADRQPAVADVAARFALGGGAVALLLSSERHPLERSDVVRADHVFALRLLDAIGPGARVVDLREPATGAAAPRPIMLSLGRPMVGSIPGFAQPLVAWAGAMGGVEWYRGEASQISLLAPGEGLRSAATANSGQDAHLVAFVRRDLALHLRFPIDVPVEGEAFPEAGSLHSPSAAWAAVRAELDGARDAWGSTDARAIKAIAARNGVAYRPVCEPAAGCAWGRLVRCEADGRCDGLLVAAGPRDGSAPGQTVADVVVLGRDVGFAPPGAP